MKTYILLAVCAASLSACSVASGNNSAYLNNGNDVSFLSQSNCAGDTDTGFDRYPMRCGPQSQR